MTQIKHTERPFFLKTLFSTKRHARKMAYTLMSFCYTTYRCRLAQVKVRGSWVEEKKNGTIRTQLEDSPRICVKKKRMFFPVN